MRICMSGQKNHLFAKMNKQMHHFKVEPLQCNVWPSFAYLHICISGQRNHCLNDTLCVCDMQISGPKTNFVFVNHKHIINLWLDFCWQEWGVAHSTPTDQKPSNAPIFVHSSAGAWRPKEKPARGGWGILNKRQMGGWGAGEVRQWHVERGRRCNKRWYNNHPGQMRGRRNEGWHNNQTARQKAVAHQAVAGLQEAT